MRREHCDVVIIGGGPAGSAAAIRLRQIGLDVIIVEAALFPRPKIGESLTPAVLPLLESLGLRGEVEDAGFPRPAGAWIRWRDEPGLAPPVGQPGALGMQADRAVFDQILLRRAARDGARVLMPARATPRRSEEGWSVAAQSPAGPVEIGCRYLLDAAGRHGAVRSGRRDRVMPATLALHAYWADHGLSGSETRVEALADCWLWAAPLSDRKANIAVFLDPGALGVASADLPCFYRSRLAGSALLSSCLHGRMITRVAGCNAAADMQREPIGQGFACVGDAALSVDPLSAQGTHLALVMGVQGAAVANTVLADPAKQAVAERFYRDQVAGWSRHYAEVSAQFYRERAALDPSTFWADRAGPDESDERPDEPAATLDPETPLRLSPEARLVGVGILSGDRIDEVTGLTRPGLDRPVALLAGVPVQAVIGRLLAPGPAYRIAAALIPLMGETAAIASVQSLWRQRILTADPPPEPMAGVAWEARAAG
ncbi:MAG: tryptophan 7-halogenase [Thalassobaculum sp.]|uniref:flavin-dependent monooxygenase QhpG n=1 Tax=Thalassobaculum sp. TaxID=2022740 RepID=UPI0032EACC53